MSTVQRISNLVCHPAAKITVRPARTAATSVPVRIAQNSRRRRQQQPAASFGTIARRQQQQQQHATQTCGAQRRSFSGTAVFKMATDDDYMAFLNKANQDADDARTSAAAATAQSSGPALFKATDAGSEVPLVIRDVCRDAVYVSEADEPFEGVSLKWSGGGGGEGGLPNEVEFAKLIHHWDAENAEVDIMDPLDWDARGQYVDVIEAVRQASRGNDVRVYRVARDRSRVEYWVISRDDEEGRIVGVKALGVES